MLEYLPRIYFLCSKREYKHIPIVINDNLHENIIESLNLIVGDRLVYIIKDNSKLKVRKLYHVTDSAEIPFMYRKGIVNTHSNFHRKCIMKMRSHLASQSRDSSNFSKRIFVYRKSGGKLIQNFDEIYPILVSRGFEVIYPEDHTFVEQIEMFKNAQIVMGTSGSALTNIILRMKKPNLSF